jgi:uncharacterized peroxidase-related enzyme
MQDNTSKPQPLVHTVAPTELQGEAKSLFEQMMGKSGKVPLWMQVMANNQDIVVAFFNLFKVSMDDSPLPANLKWKVALKVSQLNKCEYCVDVSESKLKGMGIADENLEKIHDDLTDREKLAIEYAENTTLNAYKLDQGLLDRVKAEFNDAELVELTAVVGLFNFINRFNDALGVLPEM